MTIKVLTVEDSVEFYDNYLLRIFNELLPAGAVEFVHASTLEASLEMLTQTWDIILMDFEMAGQAPVELAPSHFVRHGGDLVRLRRAAEQLHKIPASQIIGIASQNVCNEAMLKAGATQAILKLHVEQIAAVIKEQILSAK